MWAQKKPTVESIDLPAAALEEREGRYRGLETAIVIEATRENGALLVSSWDRSRSIPN
jgi:hypothetical protein